MADPRSKIKYILHPGVIRTDSDGKEHYFGPRMLAALFGVLPSKCTIDFGDGKDDWKRGVRVANCVHLYPQADGIYVVPLEPRFASIEDHILYGYEP